MSTRRHTALIRTQLDAMDEVLAGAGLVLDPDEGVYHLVVATFQQLPRSLELMGQMRARGSALLAGSAFVAACAASCWGISARASTIAMYMPPPRPGSR